MYYAIMKCSNEYDTYTIPYSGTLQEIADGLLAESENAVAIEKRMLEEYEALYKCDFEDYRALMDNLSEERIRSYTFKLNDMEVSMVAFAETAEELTEMFVGQLGEKYQLKAALVSEEEMEAAFEEFCDLMGGEDENLKYFEAAPDTVFTQARCIEWR